MKKIKLFLSLCMMCLCVAVLCMGILATGSATYQINGNISYNMIDGVARINTRVYKVSGDPASESDLQTAVTGTFLTTSSFAVIEANQSPIYAQTYQNKETLEYTDTPTTKDYDINVVYGAKNDADAYYTYYVVIQIYNQTETSGYVLNASITNTDGTEIANTSSSYVATNTSVSNIAKDTFSNIVIGISAQTIAKAQALTNSTETFAYKLSVTYEEIPWPLTLMEDTENKYWYTTLGQVSSTDTTPIRWRYIGVETANAPGKTDFVSYNYEKNVKPAYTSGAIFIQETYLVDTCIYSDSGDFTGRLSWNSTYSKMCILLKNPLTTFHLDSIPTFIQKRAMYSQIWSQKIDGVIYTNYEESEGDFDFWCLVGYEIEAMLGSSAAWKPYGCSDYVNWWTSQCNFTSCGCFYINTSGDFTYGSCNSYYALRTAFQLA